MWAMINVFETHIINYCQIWNKKTNLNKILEDKLLISIYCVINYFIILHV